MDDMIYCVNESCPYKDCNRSAHQFDGNPDKRKAISTANMRGICLRYIYYAANEYEKENNK